MSMSGAGPSSPSGVVRNSALAFVDAQQPQAAHTQDECMQDTSRDQMGQTDRMPMPAGLKALCEVYSRLYPDQPNPLQVTTRLKYWLGGHDPLDYISMYWNPGKPEENIPPHWHYVSFGISDLHGDGRVHPPSRDGSSGLGLELTFRLHADGHSSPPLWPAALLQATARYMFTYNNKFCAGDHISWHAPLDPRAASRVRHLLVSSDPQLAPARTPHGAVQFLQSRVRHLLVSSDPQLAPARTPHGAVQFLQSRVRHLLVSSEPQLAPARTPHGAVQFLQSRVRHLLVSSDPQLAPARTPHGAVQFLQLVGCTGRELRAAQRGSGFDVLKLISEDPRCDAGSWLVTRVNRRVSARGVRLAPGAPAQLAGVSARLQWAAVAGAPTEAEPSPPELPACVEQQIKDTLQRGLSSMSSERTGPEGHMSTDSFEMSSIERALPHVPELMQDSRSEGLVEYFDEVHIVMNAEGASLLPLAIDGRVSHGRHFTWREGERAVTLVPPSVAGAIATPARPLAASGAWLQVLIPKELAEDMSKKVSHLSQLAETDSESDSDEEASKQSPEPIMLPLTLSWPKYRIKITVVKNHELL
ncbi:suppressor of fused homolog [Ostrinia nubilalis]|uniref:suppressor of fused homolog n=1 Tax=Ostrinia nubilalis TaxID=29057 RepID=UPI00308265F7